MRQNESGIGGIGDVRGQGVREEYWRAGMPGERIGQYILSGSPKVSMVDVFCMNPANTGLAG